MKAPEHGRGAGCLSVHELITKGKADGTGKTGRGLRKAPEKNERVEGEVWTRLEAGPGMCPLGRGYVSSFGGNVSSFLPNVSTSARDVSSFRRRASARLRGAAAGRPGRGSDTEGPRQSTSRPGGRIVATQFNPLPTVPRCERFSLSAAKADLRTSGC